MSENEKDILVLSGDIPEAGEPCVDGEGDILGRAYVANRLTDIVKNAAKHKSYTVSLHGGWGTGKTYLLRGWQKQLQQQGCRVVYFNAWLDDFQTNPLVAIIGQLWKATPWKARLLDAFWSGEWKKLFWIFVQKRVLGRLGLSKKDIQSTNQKTVDEYLAERKKLDSVRNHLGELARESNISTGFPLVFIVDELDRCRPTFAIEVLERVKHLFDAPNIVFVFGVNKEVLGKSIESVYGDIDAEDYLRRFFDIPLNLPPASASAYCRFLLKHTDLDTAMKKMEVVAHPDPKAREPWRAATRRIFSELVGYMHFSLREVEHAIRLLRFAIKARISSSREGARDEAWSISLLILLKMKKPAIYADFVGGKLQCAEVINYFHDLLPPHRGERKTHRQRDTAQDPFSIVEEAMYRFGEKDKIMNALESVVAVEEGEAVVIHESVKGHLAKRTVNNYGSASNVLGLIHDMDSIYWLSIKEMAALLDLADDRAPDHTPPRIPFPLSRK